VTTTFDKQYRDATLSLDCTIANEGINPLKGAALNLSLFDPSGKQLSIAPVALTLDTLAPGTSQTKTISIPVASPLHWDNEHPNLYRHAKLNKYADLRNAHLRPSTADC
jgi:beta-galactosidase/beta-glucuronidase